MGKNTDSESIEVTRFCRVGCSDFLEQLRRVLKRSDIDPFKIQKMVEDILLETFLRCYAGEGSTVLDILEDIRGQRVSRQDMINVLLEFEDYIYKDRSLSELRRYTVVDVKFIFDTPLMEVEYHETVPKEESQSFTRYIRRLRQAGEVIHPEVDKALTQFHSELEHVTATRPRRVHLRNR